MAKTDYYKYVSEPDTPAFALQISYLSAGIIFNIIYIFDVSTKRYHNANRIKGKRDRHDSFIPITSHADLQ